MSKGRLGSGRVTRTLGCPRRVAVPEITKRDGLVVADVADGLFGGAQVVASHQGRIPRIPLSGLCEQFQRPWCETEQALFTVLGCSGWYPQHRRYARVAGRVLHPGPGQPSRLFGTQARQQHHFGLEPSTPCPGIAFQRFKPLVEHCRWMQLSFLPWVRRIAAYLGPVGWDFSQPSALSRDD